MGQTGFLCVLLLRRQDGWVCEKLDGRAWAATFAASSNLLSSASQQPRRASTGRLEQKAQGVDARTGHNKTSAK